MSDEHGDDLIEVLSVLALFAAVTILGTLAAWGIYMGVWG